MALPKKASRSIEVGGRQYRWMVRRCRNPVGQLPSTRLTVETEEGVVHQRDFSLKYAKDDYGDDVEVTTPISPADVKEFIHELVK